MHRGGYINRVLRVDLTNRTFAEETLDDRLVLEYLGGRGFGMRWLYQDVAPGIDPLGPDNELILLTGPLAGTNAQSFPRFKICFKSPLSGTCFKSSGGGHLAPELKFAGFDALIIRGQSDRPVYLLIRDGQYELRDATHLWGLDVDDTQALLREELRDPKLRMACIGPAGERLARYAAVMSDRRAAGRGGGGAVMGSKLLKAIAVRGIGRVPIAQPDEFAQVVREQIRLYQNDPAFPTFSKQGTQSTQDVTLPYGTFPTRNFQEGVLPFSERIEGEAYDRIRVRHLSCHSCMVHCASITKVNSGRYAGAWTEGPEYETLWGFTGPIVSSEIGLTVAADRLCDRLGLDTISTASTIGFAYECFERGLITREDTGGLELRWGNDEPVLQLIEQIAYRKGIGDLLAEGSLRAARRIGQGSEHYAIQVKGIEIPAYDPRGLKGQGLNMITCASGADHNNGYSNHEMFGTPWKVDRLTLEGKGWLCKFNQDITAVQNCGIMCIFAGVFMTDFDVYGRLLATCTGIPEFADPAHLWKLGERISNLERMFSVREGFRRQHDKMPDRLTTEPLPAGPSKGQVFEERILLDQYYRERGWDQATGIPTNDKLLELGLDFTILHAMA